MLILALPDVPGQIRALAKMLGMSGAEWQWWNYAGVMIGSFLILFSFYPLWRRMLRFLSGDGMTLNWTMIRNTISFADVGRVIILVILIAFGIYVFTRESPSFVWKHPTLPLAKQKEIVGECRMRAIDALGGRMAVSHMRKEYRAACLTSKGFKLEQVIPGRNEHETDD